MIGSIMALVTFLTVSAEEFEARYWFDFDSDNCHISTVNSSNGQLSLQLDQLSNKPIHQLNFQIKKTDGEWSTVYTQFFKVGYGSDMSLTYTFDGLPLSHPLDMANPELDVAALWDGLHRVSIADKNGCITPCNQMFYKTSVPEKNLTLLVGSTRNNVLKKFAAESNTGEFYVDVSDLQAGIYPINAMLCSGTNSVPVATSSAMVNVNPVGGDMVSGIYYWLDDSVVYKKAIVVKDGSMPFTYSDDIDVSGFNVATSDYVMAIDEDGPKITPNYNLGVSVLSNVGFQTDTTSYFTDRSKTQSLNAVALTSGEQCDFGKVSPSDVLWAKFSAQENDVIRFLPRYKSSAKFFDGSATPLDTIAFDDSNIDTRFKIATNGMHYVQVYDVDESVRDFSVKMEYLDGPSLENPIGRPQEYEGILIDWESSAQWSQSETQLTLDKNNIRVEVHRMESNFMPTVAERTNLCKVYQSNELIFRSNDYIDKITLCVPSEYVIPQIEAAEGSVSINRKSNTVVWEGLSNTVRLTVKKYLSSDIVDDMFMPEFMFEKAYVKLSDIDDSMYVDETNQAPEDYDYVGYNCMRIWENGSKVGEYFLNEKVVISIDKNYLFVTNGGETNTHEIKDHLIITYSNDPHISGIDTPELVQPSVKIADESMEFNGLPNFIGIYALDGRVIFHRYVDDPTFRYPIHDLAPGIYIVKVGDSTTKMLIK